MSTTDLTRLFGSVEGGWGLGDYWREATLGTIEIIPSVFEIGALELKLPAAVPPGAPSNDPRRVVIVSHAIITASQRGFDLHGFDGLVVWIDGPSDAGALQSAGKAAIVIGGRPVNAAVLDGLGSLTFLAHEIGHVLGYAHSLGPLRPASIKPDGSTLFSRVYNDRSCLMSAMTFDGTNPTTTPAAAGIAIPKQYASQVWWNNLGPLPCAAASYLHAGSTFSWHAYPGDDSFPGYGFARGPGVSNLGASWQAEPRSVKLYSLSDPPPEGHVLATFDADGTRWFIEYRTSHRWDAGLAPGVYVHRHEQQYSADPVVTPGAELVEFLPVPAEGDRDYSPPSGAFNVTVNGQGRQDGHPWVSVQVAPGLLPPSIYLVATSEEDSPWVPVQTVNETIRDFCIAGEYQHTLRGADIAIRVNAQCFGLERVEFDWWLGAMPVPREALALLTLPSPEGSFPEVGSVPVRANAPVIVRTTHTGSHLEIVVLSGSGNFDLPITCSAVGWVPQPAGAPPAFATGLSATKKLTVQTAELELDPALLQRQDECALVDLEVILIKRRLPRPPPFEAIKPGWTSLPGLTPRQQAGREAAAGRSFALLDVLGQQAPDAGRGAQITRLVSDLRDRIGLPVPQVMMDIQRDERPGGEPSPGVPGD